MQGHLPTLIMSFCFMAVHQYPSSLQPQGLLCWTPYTCILHIIILRHNSLLENLLTSLSFPIILCFILLVTGESHWFHPSYPSSCRQLTNTKENQCLCSTEKVILNVGLCYDSEYTLFIIFDLTLKMRFSTIEERLPKVSPQDHSQMELGHFRGAPPMPAIINMFTLRRAVFYSM